MRRETDILLENKTVMVGSSQTRYVAVLGVILVEVLQFYQCTLTILNSFQTNKLVKIAKTCIQINYEKVSEKL